MYGQRPSWRASFEAVRISKNERPVDGVLVPFISTYQYDSTSSEISRTQHLRFEERRRASQLYPPLHVTGYRHRALAPMKHPITLLPTGHAALMHSSQPSANTESGRRGLLRHESSDVESRVRHQCFPLRAPLVPVPMLTVFVTSSVGASCI